MNGNREYLITSCLAPHESSHEITKKRQDGYGKESKRKFSRFYMVPIYSAGFSTRDIYKTSCCDPI